MFLLVVCLIINPIEVRFVFAIINHHSQLLQTTVFAVVFLAKRSRRSLKRYLHNWFNKNWKTQLQLWVIIVPSGQRRQFVLDTFCHFAKQKHQQKKSTILQFCFHINHCASANNFVALNYLLLHNNSHFIFHHRAHQTEQFCCLQQFLGWLKGDPRSGYKTKQ